MQRTCAHSLKGPHSQYWSTYCDGITCGPPSGAPKLVGDATGGSAGVEAMLDIESITGVAGNVEAEFWGFSGRSPDNPENEPFMKWLTQVSQTSDDDVPIGTKHKRAAKPLADSSDEEMAKRPRS